MKGFKQIFLFAIVGFLMVSCVTSRKVNYMQEPDKHIPTYADTLTAYRTVTLNFTNTL